MSLITRIGSLFSKRADDKRSHDDDDRWYSAFIAETASGITVTPESACGTAAVYSCISAISQTIACMPLLTYERTSDGGRERAVNSPFYFLLNAMPNDWMTSGEWVEMLLVHLLLRGNAYTFKLRDKSGRIIALVPLNPTRMTVYQLDDMSINYRYVFKNGSSRDLSQREVMHFRTGFTDGLTGRSPISVARETAALTIAADKFTGKFYKNGAKLSGILTHPNKLDKATSDRIRQSWQAAHGGESEAFKVAVVEEGMKFEPISMSAHDAQFIEQRRFQLEEMARIFRVPPHIVGDLSRATFSNIEQQGINFVVYSLQPYIKRIEQTLMMNLFVSKVGNKELYAEFLIDGLLRGDTKTRNEAYEIMRRNGILSANEWRKLENMSPIKDISGDKYLVEMNMVWQDKLGETPPAANPALPAPDAQKEEPTVKTEVKSLPTPQERALVRACFSNILNRLIYKETEALERLTKKENNTEKINEWITEHEKTCRSAIFPQLGLYAYHRSMYADVPLNDKVVEILWNDFWKKSREPSYASVQERSATLSNILCESVEAIYDAEPKLLPGTNHEEYRTA